MTIEQTNNLPITEMLEERRDEIIWKSGNKEKLQEISDILLDVRTLELSLIEKAKTEERNRIVWIINEMIEKYSRKSHWYDGTGWYVVDTNRVEEMMELIKSNQ